MASRGEWKDSHFMLEGVTQTEGDSFVQHGGSVVAALRPGPAQVSVSRDMGVRPALWAYLDRQELASPDTTLIEELGLCQGLARIDLATVGGVLHGYEIKSNRDRLSRLASQAETYKSRLRPRHPCCWHQTHQGCPPARPPLVGCAPDSRRYRRSLPRSVPSRS